MARGSSAANYVKPARGAPMGLTRLPPAPGCAPHAPAYRRVAFVHINKAGGTSMRAVLYKYASHHLIEHVAKDAHKRMALLGSRFFHASASLQRQVAGADVWSSSFTFALVRNPWARQ
eukprot:921397-Prymnesium_polylepis.1